MAVLPEQVPALPGMTSQPASAARVGAVLRAVATGLQDVQAWADRGAAPRGWSGDAAEAASHAATRFARHVDVAEEAVQLATVATTVFHRRLIRLHATRTCLDGERRELNHEIAVAVAHAASHPLDHATTTAAAAYLGIRARRLRTDIAGWRRDVRAAEEAYAAALARLDTVVEARRAARAEPLPDTDVLRHRLIALAADAAAVSAWWGRLSVAERQALTIADPETVGSTDGIPVVARDLANRANASTLRDYLAQRRKDGQLGDRGTKALANLDKLREAIQDHPGLKVIRFDPFAYDGDGAAVVSLGNPDRAASVTSYTPGLTSRGGQLSDLDRVVDLHHAMAGTAGGAATILYLDYDAPDASGFQGGADALTDQRRFDEALDDLVAVAHPAAAEDGGRRLAGFLSALAATRDGPARVTVVGHSYGSVAAAYAAHASAAATPPGGHPAMDSVVLLACPGVPGHDVHDLVGDSGIEVYVGDDDHDAVSLLGRGPEGGLGTLGDDAAAASYGATRISVPEGGDRLSELLGNHSAAKYLSGVGLANVTAIERGEAPEVVEGRTAGSYQGLGRFLQHAQAHEVPVAAPLVDTVETVVGHDPVVLAPREAWALLPDGAKQAVGRAGLDLLGGTLRLGDAELHGIDDVLHSAPVVDAVTGGPDALVHAGEAAMHDAEQVVGDLSDLLGGG